MPGPPQPMRPLRTFPKRTERTPGTRAEAPKWRGSSSCTPQHEPIDEPVEPAEPLAAAMTAGSFAWLFLHRR
eukprot:7570776-Lingulodinium_polyedra.AAC.1